MGCATDDCGECVIVGGLDVLSKTSCASPKSVALSIGGPVGLWKGCGVTVECESLEVNVRFAMVTNKG